MAPLKYASFSNLVVLAKNRLEKIKGKIEEISTMNPLPDTQVRKLRAYIVEATRKQEDFQGNLTRVLDVMTDEEMKSPQFVHEQDIILELSTDVICLAQSLLPQEVPPSPSSQSDQSTIAPISHSGAHVSLPRLSLKHFDGDLVQWISFINIFDTAVHRNAGLTSVLKMQYLMTSLSKEPLNMIKSLDITAENYLVAYQLLRDRYHNPRRLQALHLNALLDLPNITSGDNKRVRGFLNSYAEHVQALKALQIDIASDSNPLLSALLLRRLDTALSRKLENFRTTKQETLHTLPLHSIIIEFLQLECTIAEDADLCFPSLSPYKKTAAPAKVKPQNQVSSRPNYRPHVAMTATSSSSQGQPGHQASPQRLDNSDSTQRYPPCFVCGQTTHRVYTCAQFQSLPVKERHNLVSKQSRCFGCLGSHSVKACQSQRSCFKCHKRHHTLLHSDPINAAHTPQVDTSSLQSTTAPHVALASQAPPHPSSHTSTTVLLGTTLVQLTATNGRSHVFRGLLDSGSTSNFISEHAAQLLGGPRLRANVLVTGIAQSSTHTRGRLDLNVKTLSNQLLASSQPMFILDKISISMPRVRLLPEVVNKAHAYVLADPTFHLPGSIDVLLGGNLFPHLLTNESYSLGPQMPHVLGTHFGFILMGEAPCVSHLSSTQDNHQAIALLSTNDVDLHSSLQKFWTHEEPPQHTSKSEEELLCEQHYVSTHKRDSTGRYCVSLPFKDNAPALGNSQLSAERRFCSLEHRFHVQPLFKELYVQFMEEYLALGHMTKDHSFDCTSPHYFLPHHGVMKENSSSTKLRTVFDASCKSSNGLSLNNVLLPGPKLQTNICDLMLYFRYHNIVFACDIRQMYRQILVDDSSQRFQRIVWRNSPSEELCVYKLKTVTYGVNCSPYLAIRTLHQLAEDEGHRFPAAAVALKGQTYVDDILTGADTVAQARELKGQLIDLLARGGFELRKWTSNSPEVLEGLPHSHLETPVFLEASDQPHVSILGLHWSPSLDCLSYKVATVRDNTTKRQILSVIAQIYDPCGFLAPVTMWCKCYMQLLWTLGFDWDEVIPSEHLTKWHTFLSQLKDLEQIQIPRPLQVSQACSVELHGFSDASEAGYAAVVYLRSLLADGTVVIRQLLSKTRVAPLKRITLPRLELCAAHLLAQLVSYCKTVLSHISLETYFLWCDSTVALTWMRTPPYQLKTYVANRVAQIQELVPTQWWYYVQSEHNAADCASRGVLPSQLPNLDIWWVGPAWLSEPPNQWPDARFQIVELSSTHEAKDSPLTVLVATPLEEWTLLSRFSSWGTLQRVTAYVLRFIWNCRHSNKYSGTLTVSELNLSRNHLVRLVQKTSFTQEITSLQRSQSQDTGKHTSTLHSPRSRLCRLSPFLDKDGLLRVGGRLSKSHQSQDAKHPLLLPKQHYVVDLIIDFYHVCYLHAGAQLTQSLISQRFWILSARSKIRSRIFKCITCFRAKPRNSFPQMADLPTARVTPSKVFLSTGMDYAGPFYTKTHQLRGVKHLKVYLCIFICLATKAVHIEVVEDLTSVGFIAALTRFISRRGRCNDLYSDCGTNFVGADVQLRKTLQSLFLSSSEALSRYVTTQEIRFHFNPPAAPHFGGLWESAVKSAKHHVRRVLGDHVLTLPEFITLATQVEAMLNSRPLTPLSSDPQDLQALTPGHFLTGAPLVSIPEENLHAMPTNRLKHYQLIQSMHQRIWRRWQLEYLHTLQHRPKWTKAVRDLQIGDMVLVSSPSPPLSWQLGRILAVFPGADNIVRVVDVKTTSGILRRPAVKVFALPSCD